MKMLYLKRLSGTCFFATRYIKEVEKFLLIYFIKTTNMKDYILEDKAELRKVFGDTMDGQFEHDLYNKSPSNQPKSDGTDTLQQRIEWWMAVVDRGGPIANDAYDHGFADLFNLYREAIDPETRGLIKLLRAKQINPKKTNRKAKSIMI